MISVLIETLNDDMALVATLASLVPAAAEGVVREVVVADRGSTDRTREIADALGCRMVEADRRAALGGLKGEWVLMLRPGLRLDQDWAREATNFMEWADKRSPGIAAVFRLSVDRFGLAARLREWAVARPGRWRMSVAVLARREVLARGDRLTLRRIRARAYLQD